MSKAKDKNDRYKTNGELRTSTLQIDIATPIGEKRLRH